MANPGRECRGLPRGANQAPPVFDQQAFAEAVGIAAAAIAQVMSLKVIYFQSIFLIVFLYKNQSEKWTKNR